MALGHEFWIEPARYAQPAGEPLIAQLKNGQDFAGNNQTFFERRFTRFELIGDGQVLPVAGRSGDIPALTAYVPGDGLWTIVHETTPLKLTYKTWEKFQAFADHKAFPDIRARHDARGLPEAGFVETYTRHAKALVAVGDGVGADVATGMETEFVALANPYTDDLTAGFPVRLLYQAAPRADAQIEIFDRAPDGSVTVTTTRTDAAGEAVIPVQSGHEYLLDGVVLRPADPATEDDAVWRTLWAALTFAVP